MREQFNLLTTYRVHYQLSETVVARQTDRGDFPGRPICPVQSEVNHYVVSATKPQTFTEMMQYEWGGGNDILKHTYWTESPKPSPYLWEHHGLVWDLWEGHTLVRGLRNPLSYSDPLPYHYPWGGCFLLSSCSLDYIL